MNNKLDTYPNNEEKILVLLSKTIAFIELDTINPPVDKLTHLKINNHAYSVGKN